MNLVQKEFNVDRKLFLLIFIITFTIFTFTNDAHRYTFDEDIAQRQTMRIITLQPDPLYVEGESHVSFEFPELANLATPLCRNAIWCSGVYVGHTLTQIPFVFINNNLNIVTQKTVLLTNEDFNDPHYIMWRNSLDPDFTFLELFYGSIFSSLSVAVFFAMCELFGYRKTTSLSLTTLFAFSTMVWAYSQTSLNLVPVSFFVIFGLFFFIKYLKIKSLMNLLLSGLTLGFAYMVRPDAILSIGIVLLFLVLYSLKTNRKAKSLLSFVIPVSVLVLITRGIDFLRYDAGPILGSNIPENTFPLHIGAIGLLFSPGVGIFVFYPILILCFLGFVDFYKRNKFESLLFLSLITVSVVFYGTIEYWHGMNAWAARYMLTIIPLFLIPLGATLENRNNKIWVVVLVLAGIGFLSNVVYVIQDENWFVWGIWGSERGLTSLGVGLNIHPAAMWTLEYSQLTHSIITAFTNLQPDIFLLKLFGGQLYTAVVIGVLAPLVFFVIHLLRKETRLNPTYNKLTS